MFLSCQEFFSYLIRGWIEFSGHSVQRRLRYHSEALFNIACCLFMEGTCVSTNIIIISHCIQDLFQSPFIDEGIRPAKAGKGFLGLYVGKRICFSCEVPALCWPGVWCAGRRGGRNVHCAFCICCSVCLLYREIFLGRDHLRCEFSAVCGAFPSPLIALHADIE